MEALGADLVGMKTKGISLLGGSQDIWKERKGMRGGEEGRGRQRKGKTSEFLSCQSQKSFFQKEVQRKG